MKSNLHKMIDKHPGPAPIREDFVSVEEWRKTFAKWRKRFKLWEKEARRV